MQKKLKRGSILRPSHNLIGWTILLLGALFWVTPLSSWPLVKPPLACIQHSSRPTSWLTTLSYWSWLSSLELKFWEKVSSTSSWHKRCDADVVNFARIQDYQEMHFRLRSRCNGNGFKQSSKLTNLKKKQNVNKLHVSVWTCSTLLNTAQHLGSRT